MKRTLVAIFLTMSLCLLAFVQPSSAADIADGAKIFKANCIGCHLQGNNNVVKNKTLKLAALQEYGMYSIEAITKQVTNGKNGMPAFGKKLNAEQIENVANYVLSQADNGWAKKK
ncbi:c-type cytochrome [Tumidithrix elongata RA019]|uniref:Cytochrome c6 n=1 Tax=Tumidithrix elongata BACA0141 TaxID=2716417 RepID=A0AAW9PVX0_9CYAN|nr:c-type cytochrome [Tumidithrix elongata RA019]